MRPAPIPNKGSFSSVAYGCYYAAGNLKVAGLSEVWAGVSDPIWYAAVEAITPINAHALGNRYAND